MKAIVFHDVGDIRLENVPEPKIEKPNDAIVRLTASAICGTDLHMIRGTLPGMQPGTILGHEGVGVVEKVGEDVRNLAAGDRVVIPSTIACGTCSYCRAGYYAQCDTANPNGPQAGTAFFGGPKSSGPFHGLQAEYARIPYANVGLVKLPDEVSDEQAILISDIFPTGYFGAELAEIKAGDTVAVFGCGPVGLFAILSAQLKNAGRIFAVDGISTRLEDARNLGAEVINFNTEDPVEVIQKLTGGIGVDRAIDAVGIDAERPQKGPAGEKLAKKSVKYDQEMRAAAPKRRPEGRNWQAGDAPSLALEWAVESLAKAGTLGVVGVYSENLDAFPIGAAMEKNLTIKMGNCNHRRYIPHLVRLTASRQVHPERVLTHRSDMESAIDAFRHFDRRDSGWTKVELLPQAA